jgi:peptide/nickel transport system permease protein
VSLKNTLKRHPLMLWGGLIVSALVVCALASPLLAPADPNAQALDQSLLAPSFHHWLGTDQYGRDVLSRVIYGARISLSVGLVAVSLYVAIGVGIGAVAGYYGGWVDLLLMRFVDIMLCIPTLFLILMVIAFVGPSIFNVMIVIGLTSWMGVARLVRGEILSLKERDFVTAARVIGMKDARIIFTQLLPNALGPVLVVATLGVGSTILTESALSFLGLGVQPPTASWGNMLTEGKEHLTDAWWLVTFPGLAIFITVLGYNLLGQGLRDWMDPRHQGKS